MQVSSSSRQLNALPKICRRCSLTQTHHNRQSPAIHRRHLHYVPKLPYEEHFRTHGVGSMLTPTGFDLAWTQYQSHLVSQLNSLTAGTKDGERATKDLLLTYARNPTRASLFNYASMAWNTHHVMTTLSPTPERMSSSLERRVNTSFSSAGSLKATFVATANAMFGPGFVWLIRDNNVRENNPANDPQLSILATYIAGSPLPGAHFRRQPTDMNTENPADTPYASGGLSAIRRTAGAFGSHSGSLDSKLGMGGAYLEVMLGVCTWPHFWMGDFGVGGKKAYLEAWWESVDWAVVERNGLFDAGRVSASGLPRLGKLEGEETGGRNW